jgi:hypothetical protein
MKRIFWLLFFINIGVFAWQMYAQQDRVDEVSTAPAIPDSGFSDTLVLLSERANQRSAAGPTTASGSARSTPAPAPPPPAPKPAATAACYALGPFSSSDEANVGRQSLKALGLTAAVREQQEQRSKGFWVFYPPLPNREAAKRKLREMHRANVDSFIVTQGSKTNAISVGIYNDLTHAERRRRELVKLGIDVELEERLRTVTLYWLDLSEKSSRSAVQKLSGKMAGEFSGLRLESRACK